MVTQESPLGYNWEEAMQKVNELTYLSRYYSSLILVIIITVIFAYLHKHGLYNASVASFLWLEAGLCFSCFVSIIGFAAVFSHAMGNKLDEESTQHAKVGSLIGLITLGLTLLLCFCSLILLLCVKGSASNLVEFFTFYSIIFATLVTISDYKYGLSQSALQIDIIIIFATLGVYLLSKYLLLFCKSGCEFYYGF